MIVQGQFSSADEAELRDFLCASRKRLLDEDVSPNVVGIAVGVKWSGGRPTGRLALLVLVTRKVGRAELPAPWRIPARIGGYWTDVREVGNARPPSTSALAGRWPRAYGGCSVGHVGGTTGTMASAVHDRRTTGMQENRRSILGTNHVLANLNLGQPGDAILQPSAFDGGQLPHDAIGTLNRFIPIELEPPLPRRAHENLVDAALADATSGRVAPGIWGFQRLSARSDPLPRLGSHVKKTGRATAITRGQIVGVCATIDIRYGARIARFRDQIVTTPMIEAGDSGALLLGDGNAPIGLLFAGSTGASFANPIGRVATLLQVEIVLDDSRSDRSRS